MKKKDMSTKELALYFHTTVEEIRNARSAPEAGTGLEAKTEGVADFSKDDPDACYCRDRTDGKKYSIEVRGQRYCTLQKHCRCQEQSAHAAKKCVYNLK